MEVVLTVIFCEMDHLESKIWNPNFVILRLAWLAIRLSQLAKRFRLESQTKNLNYFGYSMSAIH